MSNAIDSKTKRDRLTPRREPYWESMQKGAAVGFRKLESGDGTWIARWRDEEGKQKYRALGNFDKFDDAAKAARAWIESLSLRVQNYPGLRVEIYPGNLAACHAVGECEV